MPDLVNPFFLVYDSRSGSTFLANCMVKSLGLVIPPESNFLDRVLIKYPKEIIENRKELSSVIEIIRSDEKFSDWGIDANTLYNCDLPVKIDALVSTILKMYGSGTGYVVKKGNLIFRHEKLKHVFPESKFICIIRDGRAVYSSKKFSLHSRTGKPFETDPFIAANTWSTITKLMHDIEDEGDGIIVKYEDLVKSPDKVMDKIAEFLSFSMIRENSKKDYVVPLRYRGLHENIDKSPMIDNIVKWKQHLRREEIFAFEKEAYETLVGEGYNPVFTKKKLESFIRYLWYKLILKTRSVLAQQINKYHF